MAQGVKGKADRRPHRRQTRPLLLNIRPRLIWKPGAHWGPVVAEIEASPEPWTGPRSSDAQERHYEFVQSLSREEYQARLAKILADIEAQQLEL